jgi:hypothetical protein
MPDTSVTNLARALGFAALGVAIAAAAIYVGEMDDAPGASLAGILIMIGLMAVGVRSWRRGRAH